MKVPRLLQESPLNDEAVWDLIGAFYLLAYAFWTPFDVFVIDFMVRWPTVTFAVLLGIRANLPSIYDEAERKFPFQINLPRIGGGIALLLWSLIYIRESNRIVAHWPLDLIVTLLAGVILVYTGILGMRASGMERVRGRAR